LFTALSLGGVLRSSRAPLDLKALHIRGDDFPIVIDYKRRSAATRNDPPSVLHNAPYRSGRGNDWVKKTCAQRETLTIAGFALDGNDWDGIYVGRGKGKDLVYAGKVDHGFDKTSAAELRRRLTPLIRKAQPYTKKIPYKGIWVEPELSAEIEYRAKSAGGKVRHPFYRGLREDL
jgi:bifunctional non-homologous end joining protein LigD